MKQFLKSVDKYLFLIVVTLSGIATYFESIFFLTHSLFPTIYITFIILVLLSAIFLADKSWTKYIKIAVLSFHLVIHGLFLLTFPIGMVFAVIGSYFLAFKIWLTVYVPSGLVALSNLYLIKQLYPKLNNVNKQRKRRYNKIRK